MRQMNRLGSRAPLDAAKAKASRARSEGKRLEELRSKQKDKALAPEPRRALRESLGRLAASNSRWHIGGGRLTVAAPLRCRLL